MTKSKFGRKQLVILSVLLLLMCVSLIFGQKTDVRTLLPNQKIERKIKSPQIHTYEIELAAGAVLHVDLQELNGFDCELDIADSSGDKIAAKSDFGNGKEREAATIIADKAGIYAVYVVPGNLYPEGTYNLTATVKKAAAESDKIRVNAEQLMFDAAKLVEENSAEKSREANVKYEKAAALWQSLNESHWTAKTFERLGKSLENTGETDKALDAFRKAVPLFKATENADREAECLQRIGKIYADKNENVQALENYNAALAIYQKTGNAQGAGVINFYLGLLAKSVKDFPKALNFLQQAAAIFKEEYSLRDEANTQIKIGDVQGELREFTSALESYNAAIELFRLLDDQKEIGKSLINIGLAYDELYERQKALDFYEKSLKIFQQIGEKKWEATALNNIAATYSDLGDLRKSLEFHERALTLRRALSNQETLINSLLNAAVVYSNFNDKQKSLQYRNEALEIARKIGSKKWEADALQGIGSVYLKLSDLKKSLQFFNEALEMRRALQNQEDLSSTLNSVGFVYKSSGEMKKALEFYRESLKIAEKTGDKSLIANVLSNIGQVYDEFDEEEKALEYFNQSLKIKREIGDKFGESVVLHNIGAVYSDLEEREKSLDFFGKSLEIKRALGNKTDEAATLSNLAVVYSNSGENQKALELLNLALPLRQTAGDKIGEASTLNDFGVVYQHTGDKSKAIEFYNRALDIRRAVGDKNGTASSLHNIGTVFNSLYEEKKALEYFAQAIEIEREIGGKRSEANLLNSIGSAYLRLKQWRKAIDSFEQSLNLHEKLNSYSGTAGALNALGVVMNDLGEKQNALIYFKKALSIYQAIDDSSGEAQILNNTGAVYFDLGEQEKAVEFYYKALPLRRLADDCDGEAATLGNLMKTFDALGQRNLAIAFGKESISIGQELRGKARDFDNETQKRFLQQNEFIYRRLTGLLLSANRPSEAHQIFNAFKDQQFFDFSAETRKQLAPLELTLMEKSFIEEYRRKNAEFAKAARNLRNAANDKDFRQNGETETPEIKKLEAISKTSGDNLQTFLKHAAIDFSAGKPSEKPLITAETREMQTVLRELETKTKQKTAVIYTLAGADNFQVLMIAPNALETFSYEIGRGELNNKATEFWAALNSPANDPRPSGRELYDIIFKQIEARLPAGTTTLMWSLDGSLRYIPMAALFDGEKYLAEKYRSVVFTRSDSEKLLRPAGANWTATGFGSSEAHTVNNLGEKISFNALPAVRDELGAIFKTNSQNNLPSAGIFGGQVFIDKNFNKSQMLAALRVKLQIVHIASHFAFRPGDDARSFLLLGDGTALTLAEMKHEKSLFEGVELLTLSACNTAAVRSDADGREIDGFSELAQRLGADAVIASLWSVADESTQLLMSEFYKIHQQNPQITKAEAMQKAQQEMISGKLKSSGKSSGCRSDVIDLDGKTQLAYKCDANAPFAHPFFWSPFVLYGNWR